METKPIPIKMKHTVHQRLKYRAKQSKVTIGAMIENLLASYELQVDRIFKKWRPEKFKTPKAEAELLNLLIRANAYGYKEQEINRRIEKIMKAADEETLPERAYIPRVEFPDDTEEL